MPLFQAARVVKDGATYAMNGATFVARGLPSAVGALQSGAQSMDFIIESIADEKVNTAINKQLYDQAWLRDNPAPYMVAITEQSNNLRAEIIQMIDYQGEVKKAVILIEVDEKIKTALKGLKAQFKDFFDQNAKASLPTVARRLAQLELEVRGSPDNHAGINQKLIDLTRRVLIIEQSAPNQQANDTSAAGNCCRHCSELKLVKADLKALVQRLFNPKKGEIDFQKMWEFCNWAGPQMEKKFREYDTKLQALDGMVAPAAAAEQARESSCRCDQNAIDALTTNVGGHGQRIKDIESLSPRVNQLWDYCEAFETERLPKLVNHMDAEFQKLGTRLSAVEGQVNPESMKSLVDAAVKAAVAEVKATYDGEIKSMKKSMEADTKAAMAKEKATFDDDVKRIENGIKSQVQAAVADLVAKKDEQIQDLNAKNAQLNNEKAALEGKLEAKDQELKKQGEKINDQEKVIEEQGKKIAAHDRIFEAIAIEQTEQNDRLRRLEQRQENGGAQNVAGPQQQQPPQGNGPFTPTPSPPHQGSQDSQGTSGDPMGFKDASVDGAQSEADLIDFDTGDDEMKEAPGHNAQPSQPQTQPAPIFGAQPAGQPQQAGGEQPFFGQGPVGSANGPTESQSSAAAPTSIFGNVGQASASDPKINWGATLGDINFANLNQPPAEPSAPEHDMPLAGPATFNPWAGGSVPSFFPQASTASGPGAPAPVAPMFASDAPSSTPSGFTSAPSQSNASPGTAPEGGFDFSMPLPPVRTGPVASGTDFGAGFRNMTRPDGRAIRPGQQLNEHGRPVIEPRSIRRTPATQAPASSPVAGPTAQPGRNFNAYVEDEQDVHMDMGGHGAGQNANPVAPAAPEATMDSEPTPVSAQPSTSGHMADPNQFQQSVEPGVLNTKFSLDVYDKWKADVRAKHTTFFKMSGRLIIDAERKERLNRVWQDNVSMMERTQGNTDDLLKELGLFHTKAKGFSKDEMSRLMSAWLEKVFLKAGIETSLKDQGHMEKNLNPATPETATRNEPAPIPTQPSTPRAVAETEPQQSQQPVQQTIQNTRYSLAFYDSWRGHMWAQNQDFAKLAGMRATESEKLDLNKKWPQKLAALDARADLTTPALLVDLKLSPDLRCFTRQEIDGLMSLWMRKVFVVAMADVSGKHQGDYTYVCSALLTRSKEECLKPQYADVA